MTKIVFANGDELYTGSISKVGWANNKILVIIPDEIGIMEAASIFSDISKTEKMEYWHTIYKETYHGFTTVDSIINDPDAKHIQIWMSGNETARIENGWSIPEEYIPRELENETEEKKDGTEVNPDGEA